LASLYAVSQPASAQRKPDPVEQARKDQAAKADPAVPASGDPIIPDSQFNDALPAIDGDLNQPLAPIESIDSMPAEPATPPVQTATPTTPSTAPQTVATPAAADPALSQPLPPLAGFDVEPPPATIGAEVADTPPELRYSVKIEGLQAVDLDDTFRSLSALDKGDGKGANGAVISARAKEDEGLAQAAPLRRLL
jgi:translocation and assembly module TamA